MSDVSTLALVGAVGGAGTTRLALESGATLARAGHDVAILDAAFETQGLADYIPGRIDPDLTAVVADGADLGAATYPVTEALPGRLRAAPARASFERLARAKTAGAAERFEDAVAEASLADDVVLVDVPPIAANQAVAAVHACEKVAAVVPDTVRGADGLARLRGRLRDVGVRADATVATFADGDRVLTGATVAIPRAEVTAPADCPSTVAPDAPLGPPVAEFVEGVLEGELGVSFDRGGVREWVR